MAHVTRFQDWQSRLDASLRETAARELEYGHLDCCLFAANVVLAITGHDPAHDLRGQYDSERAAYELMQARFGGYIEKTVAALAKRSGFEEIPVLMAQRGDVVLVGSNRQCAAGVIDMTGCGAAIYPKKLLSVPITHVRRAWRI